MGPRNVALGVADACDHPRWALNKVEFLMGPRKPYWVWRTHVATPPLGPCVELPMGPRNAVLGG
eukprot:412402-Pyramimonas_sp.AAC.1